jgi:hypothetical protein
VPIGLCVCVALRFEKKGVGGWKVRRYNGCWCLVWATGDNGLGKLCGTVAVAALWEGGNNFSEFYFVIFNEA